MGLVRVVRKNSSLPGKTALILAGVHGNETSSIRAFDELLNNFSVDRGSVIFVYCNLEAVRRNVRFVDDDLNRSFTTENFCSDKVSNERSVALELSKIIESCDVMLDLHSTSNPHSKVFAVCHSKDFSLASFLPHEFVVFGWEAFARGSTGEFAQSLGKRAVTFEVGYNDDPRSVETAKFAISNFLKGAGILNGDPKRFPTNKVYEIVKSYKNHHGSFRRASSFADFEKVVEKTLIGHDGSNQVFVDPSSVLVFVEDRQEVGRECFFVAREHLKML